MTNELRKSGVNPLGDVPWGTHFCQFFETKEDLLEILVPFFNAGVENNELCVWIVSDPMTPQTAFTALRQTIKNFDRHYSEGRIQVIDHKEWYIRDGEFRQQDAIDGFTDKLRETEAKGFEGLRAHGSETWLKQGDWANFMDYENALNTFVRGKRAIILCTYQLSTTDASALLDVAHSHERVISKRNGKWEILEEQSLKDLKTDLQQKNLVLEDKIRERTSEIEKTISELKREIYEKERIANELRKSESRYRTLIEQASDAIIIVDDHANLIEVNNSFCKMVGYPEKELIGMNLALLIEPTNLKDDPLSFEQLFRGETVNKERQLLKKNGGAFPVDANIKMLDDGRILTIIRDVTERKKTEAALRQSEDRVRLIIDTIPTMAWTVTAAGVVDYANKQWLDYAGEEKFEDPTAIIHPEDVARVMQKWLKGQSLAQAYDDEMRLRRTDGEYRWFLVRTAPLTNSSGEVIKWYGVCIDIHDSRRAQDELRLAYQALSYHVENTPLAVIEWDKNLNIKRWSVRAEEVFGWKSAEVIGTNRYDTSFKIVYEDDRDAVAKIDQELMNGLVDRNVSQNRNYTKEGRVIYCEWYNSVLRDEQGNVQTILSLVDDVTERKRADQTLRHSYTQIRQLTEHLQNIREDERTHIAREIHDELGGQLTALKMDASWLNDKLTTEQKAVKLRLKNLLTILDTMVTSVRRIAAKLRPSLLDNLGLIAAMDWQLKELKTRFGIKIRFRKPGEELEITDAVKNGLFRIFQESLTNVVRHSGAKNVSVELLQQDHHIILRVQDDGQGFLLQKEARKKTFGILGMKERTSMMGGDFQITATPGKGTNVKITIPKRTPDK